MWTDILTKQFGKKLAYKFLKKREQGVEIFLK